MISRSLSDAQPPSGIDYQPALDGLRAVAVVAVLAYHHDAAVLSGGFLGVDVFFVLSGFLITAILLARNPAGTQLGTFWLARLRRLLPPLLAGLVLVAIWAATMAPPEMLDRVRGDGLASLGWVSNWRYVLADRSYFAEVVPSPLRHLWSLGVEMQWYLVWPLVFALVARLVRSRTAAVLAGVAAVLAVISTAAMAWAYDSGSDPSRLYYGTDTHATPLLVGAALAALLAVAGPRRGRLAAAVIPAAGLAGATVLAVAMLTTHGTSAVLYQGGFAVAALATAAVILAAVTPAGAALNPLRALLSLSPLVWLGRISYGVYVFHWPLYFLITPETVGVSGWRLLALRTAATLALATASYLLIELPVRRGLPAKRALRPAAALGATFLVGAVVVASTSGATASWADRADLAAADRPVPTQPSVDDGDRPARVLLVGDSAAYTLGIGFENGVDADAELTFWNQGILFCEMVRAPRRHPDGEILDPSEPCEDWPSMWAGLVERFDPDLAVLSVGPWEIFDRHIDGEWKAFGRPEMDEVVGTTLDEAIGVLSADGAEVVLLTAPLHSHGGALPGSLWSEERQTRTSHLNTLMEQAAAAHPRATVIDLAGFVCDETECPAQRDGVELRSDGLHYTAEGAEVVARWLGPQLREIAGELDDPTEPELTDPTAADRGAAAGRATGGAQP